MCRSDGVSPVRPAAAAGGHGVVVHGRLCSSEGLQQQRQSGSLAAPQLCREGVEAPHKARPAADGQQSAEQRVDGDDGGGGERSDDDLLNDGEGG